MTTQSFVSRGICRTFLAAGCIFALSATAAQAQNFPTRPIRLISPYAPGGSTDMLARIVSKGMTKALGQPVIVEYKTGAGGSVAAQDVARAEPDGYTFALVSDGAMTINQSIYKHLPYDPIKDFAPITIAVRMPVVIISNPASPYKTVQKLIAGSKANPGKLSFGTGGVGTHLHLAGELLNSMAGADLLHVPYKGGAPAMTDLIGGRLDFIFIQVPGALSQIQSGKVRAIAVTSPERSPHLPDVPTIAESGFPGFKSESWYGFVMPARVPAEVGKKLHQAIVSALKENGAQLKEAGFEVDGGSPEAMAKIVHDDSARWAKLIKTLKIEMD